MIDLIKAATLTNDKELQKSAEATLLKHRQDHPEEFFLQSGKILNSKNVLTAIRQAAGTLLTVSLKFKTQGDVYLWHALSAPNRSAFKDMVLNTMIDSEKLIRRAAANIVAAICCIEIPRNEWPGIPQKITQNIRSEDLIVKEVSILTIGFICEQLKEFDFFFEEPLQETILTGILMGVKDTHLEIAETAFKALRDGLPAMTSIMKNTQYREYLISQIAQAIGSKHFVELGLQCLIEFIRCNYALLLPQYVEGFATLIDPILRTINQESSCVLAMEFWGTLAKEEKNIQSNPNMMKFIKGALGDRLVESLLQNLCFIQEKEEEANGISETAASTLEAVFQGDSLEYQQKILNFTSNTIHHQNWKYRQASIRAFSLLLIGLSKERAHILVNSSLLEMVSLLNDPTQYVQLSAIKSLGLITQEVPEVILHHQKFLQILQFVVKMGQGGENFLKHVCKIIDNLCAPQQSVTIIGPLAGDLIKLFLETCLDNERSISLVSNCLNVIINLIKCSRNVQLCNTYIQYVLSMYGKLHSLEKEKRDMFYSGFFTMAQVCLMTIRKVNGSITMDQLSSLYDLVVKHYIRIKDVEGDGFYLVSALAYFIPNDRRLIDDFWKYIEFGLKKLSQEEVFKSAISCICDFATTYREQISDKVDPIINEILQLYEKNMITRDLKLDVLMCIGQLFLQCGDFCVKHLKRVKDLLQLSCGAVVNLITDMNYAQILQESIIQTLMCIFHGVTESTGQTQLIEFIPVILNFVMLTTDKGKHPKLDYVHQCLMLLADIGSMYPSERSRITNAGFVNDRTATLLRFNKDGHLSQDLGHIRQQLNLGNI